MKLALALLLALACLAHAEEEARFFEDCTTTTMRLVNRKRFVGGDVFRSVKLAAGQGTLYCMNLCRADENCWSFNLNKNRKICYLQTDNDAPQQRASTWAAGYRECVPSEGNWDNPNTGTTDDSVTGVSAPTGVKQSVVTWTADAVNDDYYTATYKAILVATGASCFDEALFSSAAVAENTKSATVSTGTTTGTYQAYVQTIVDGTVRGCTAATGYTVIT